MWSRYLHILFVTALLVVAISASFVYFNDPFQVYRKSDESSPRFFRESRYQNPGIINSYLAQGAPGTVIIGTSLSESFMPSEMERLPGWGPVYKLTVNAPAESNVWVEHKTVLERALATGKVRQVLWELNDRYFQDQLKEGGSEDFPFELYDDSVFNDFNYLLNLESIRHSILLLRGGSDPIWVDDRRSYPRWVNNFDDLYNWGLIHLSWYPRDGFMRFNTPEKIGELSEDLDDRFAHITPRIEIDERFDFVQEEMLPLLVRYPEVTFFLFFPPRPLLQYESDTSASLFLSYRHAVFEAVTQLRNVTLFGFDNDSWITANAANFKDLYHFHMDINRLIAASICAGSNRIEDVAAYNNDNLALIRGHRVTSFPREDWKTHFLSKVESGDDCAGVATHWPSRQELLQLSRD